MEITTVISAGKPFVGSAFTEPIYRIPALAKTPSGRLVACFDVRSDWRDLPADFDIAVTFSDDDGASWSPARALRLHSPGHGFGDASLTCDAQGRLYCWYVGSAGHSYFSALPGEPGLELWLSMSDDDGTTWSHADMSALRPAEVGGMFASSGNGWCGNNGVLYQPLVARIAGENFAYIASSADRGQSWQLSERVGPDCDENKVIELADGRILMHARSRPHRRQAYSDNGGKSFSLPSPHAALRDPGCNGGLTRIGNYLIASICDSDSERTSLSVHISQDNGITWSAPILIDPGAAAYSVLAKLDDHRVGLMWEADNYRTILFARLSVDELVTCQIRARQVPAGCANAPKTRLP